jgi:hypothetical protein
MFKFQGTLLAEGPNWVLGCGPAPINSDPYYAEVDLKTWPCRLYSKWNDWDSFVAGGYSTGLVGKALEAAVSAIEQVREVAPSLGVLSHVRKATVTAAWPNKSLERTRDR